MAAADGRELALGQALRRVHEVPGHDKKSARRRDGKVAQDCPRPTIWGTAYAHMWNQDGSRMAASALPKAMGATTHNYTPFPRCAGPGSEPSLLKRPSGPGQLTDVLDHGGLVRDDLASRQGAPPNAARQATPQRMRQAGLCSPTPTVTSALYLPLSAVLLCELSPSFRGVLSLSVLPVGIRPPSRSAAC